MKKLFIITFVISFFAFNTSDTGKWTKKADFGGGQIYGATSFCINNIGYVGTGNKGEIIPNLTSNFYKYDNLTDVWQKIANLPATIRMYATGFSINQKGYVCGGEYSVVIGLKTLNDLWEYDPATNIWFQRKNFPRPGGIMNGIGFSIGTKGYVGLGSSDFTSFEVVYGNQNDFYEYDPIYNKWTQLDNFPGAPRQGAISFSMNGKGYVGMGWEGYKDFWEYNPSTDTWTRLPDFPGSDSYSAYGFGANDYCYIGISDPNEFYRYNTLTKVWEVLPYIPGADREGVFSFYSNNKIYFGGGTGSVGGLVKLMSDLWEYNIADPLSNNTSEMNQSKVSIYPNPTNNKITISNNCVWDTETKVSIYNAKGELIIYNKYQFQGSVEMDVSTLSKGIYLVKMQTENGNETKKLVIQ